MAAIRETQRREILWPILQRLWERMNQLGWRVKLTAFCMALVALVLPGQSAGIAAFGGAVGVPLWVIFGAGGAFAGAIVDSTRGGGPK